MSGTVKYMHSHSALEREKKIPKHVVIVDECFENRFDGVEIKHVKFGKKKLPASAYYGVYKCRWSIQEFKRIKLCWKVLNSGLRKERSIRQKECSDTQKRCSS